MRTPKTPRVGEEEEGRTFVCFENLPQSFSLDSEKSFSQFMASVDSRHSISSTHVALEDSYEGEHVETNDYYFEKIGEPVPVKLNDSIFDPGSPPSQPLAVSESFGLIFVAHLSGW